MFLLGASVEVYCDDKKNLKGIFFQDQQIIEIFKAYLELLCLDATYKLLEFRLPVYIMLCEDENGMSKTIAVCLLVQEDAESITWMVDSFKKHNPGCQKIRVIMADKDIGERYMLKHCIPNASILVCVTSIYCTPTRATMCVCVNSIYCTLTNVHKLLI